jgi:hypothetical protein
LKEICEAYDPDSHPIDLCYETRRALRERFPEILGPDQMYGVLGEE